MAKIKVLLLFVFTLFYANTYADGEAKYTPLFKVDMAYEAGAKGNVVTDYMIAAQSGTNEKALIAWQAFSASYNETETIDDLTSLLLMRQAAFELARLYYLVGKSADGDREIIRASEITVYEELEEEKARKWCQRNNYCNKRQRLF